jgi:rhodanese-related sulfurtransferase
MDRISSTELEEWQRAGRRFTLLDVRRAKVREADGAHIAGAAWRSPDGLFTWKDEVARDRPVVVVCAHGHELSQGAAATLRAMGLDARFLVDGFSGWRDSGRPTVPASVGQVLREAQP